MSVSNIEVNDKVFENVDKNWFLGLIFNRNLTLNKHSKLDLNQVNSGLFAINLKDLYTL